MIEPLPFDVSLQLNVALANHAALQCLQVHTKFIFGERLSDGLQQHECMELIKYRRAAGVRQRSAGRVQRHEIVTLMTMAASHERQHLAHSWHVQRGMTD